MTGFFPNPTVARFNKIALKVQYGSNPVYDGYVLTWDYLTEEWKAKPLSESSGAAGGDLSGVLSPNPTVSKINGVSVPAGPSAGFVLVAINGTSVTWEQICNANISAGAAIAVTKSSPGTSATLI